MSTFTASRTPGQRVWVHTKHVTLCYITLHRVSNKASRLKQILHICCIPSPCMSSLLIIQYSSYGLCKISYLEVEKISQKGEVLFFGVQVLINPPPLFHARSLAHTSVSLKKLSLLSSLSSTQYRLFHSSWSKLSAT